MGKGIGFGKVILFNEHFVVHGIPSIASAIEMETTAVVETIQSKNTWELKDERKATPGYKEDKKDQQADSIDNIFRAMNLMNKCNVRITLGGSLVAASGVGASAASCVAIARALNDEFKLNLLDERINEIAFEGEKGYHGTPSGIDNTVATFGSLIWYKRDVHGTVMEKIKMKMPVEIVMGNSGLVTNTKAAVEGVERRKAENPAEFAKLFKSAEELAVKARKALENNKIGEVGALMNENHKLLQEIGVSCPKLDNMVELARKNGAIGAKLTGGGLGGYMVALTLGKDVQEKVAKALEKEGYHVLRTRIGINASN